MVRSCEWYQNSELYHTSFLGVPSRVVWYLKGGARLTADQGVPSQFVLYCTVPYCSVENEPKPTWFLKGFVGQRGSSSNVTVYSPVSNVTLDQRLIPFPFRQ